MKSSFGFSLFFGLAIFSCCFFTSCTHEPFLDPNSLNEGNTSTPGCNSDGTVCFESSVLPIFISSCARQGCHDVNSRSEGYILDSYANIVRKGIRPNNASESELFEVLTKSGEDQMPPDGKLSQAKIDSIRLWINQGAKNTTNCSCFCDTTLFAYSADIKPIIDKACIGCHKPGSKGGDIDLSTYAQVVVQVNNGNLIGAITHGTGYVSMPPGSKLPDCEIIKIQKWVLAGAQNN